MQIEIIKDSNAVTSRNGTNKQTGVITQYFSQEAYAHLGGHFPVQIKIPVEDSTGYPVG